MSEAAQPSLFRRLAVALSWFGLGASVLVQVVSFFGVSLFERFVFLHFGVFVLGIPAVFSRRKMPGWPPGAAWRALLEGAPPWAGRGLQIAWIYFALNMVALFILGEGGSPAVQDGRFILHSHGELIRELTESEYRWQLSHVSRMFSAGWALAYTFFVVWYSARSSTDAHRAADLGRSDRPA